MSKKKALGICMIVLCAAGALFSGGMLWKKHMDAEKSRMAFEELAGHVSTNEMMNELGLTESREIDQEVKQTGMILTEQEKETLEWMRAHEIYGEFYEKNPDFVGWICIDGTNINYPVMQTPKAPTFYMRKNFEKEYSVSGTPFLDAASTVGKSKNYLIYGHNIKSGTMFHQLLKYEKETFYEKHKTFTYDQVVNGKEVKGTYRVVAVFRSRIYPKGSHAFKYYAHPSITEEETYNAYVHHCKALSSIDTGVTPKWGQQLVTLSTCAYHVEDGRFAVVGVKVD